MNDAMDFAAEVRKQERATIVLASLASTERADAGARVSAQERIDTAFAIFSEWSDDDFEREYQMTVAWRAAERRGAFDPAIDLEAHQAALDWSRETLRWLRSNIQCEPRD